MSVPTTAAFKERVLGQLLPLGDVSARAMFGGHGLYCDGLFFAALAGDRLYFKVDDESRQDYIARGLAPFMPTPGQTMSSYYEVPPEVIDDQPMLLDWATRAVGVARQAATAKAARPGRRQRR
jgi:DNA transformation protein and related proteins